MRFVLLSLPLALTSFSGLKITADVGNEDTAYLEDVKSEKRVIDVTLTIRRSTLVIGYCLVITLTICLSPFPSFIRRIDSFKCMDRAGHSDDLLHHDFDCNFRLPTAE